ncbi:MAG: type II toxin-antitoxin system HicA family toxin [Rhodospirillales bacterium]
MPPPTNSVYDSRVSCSSPRSRWPLARLPLLSGRQVCIILAKHGFEEVRRRGSHIVMQKVTPEGICTVPVPDHREIRIGTLLSIIRQSNLPRTAFET